MKFSLHVVRSSVACVACAATLLAPRSVSPAFAEMTPNLSAWSFSVPANNAQSSFKGSLVSSSPTSAGVFDIFQWTSKSGTYSYGFGTDSSGVSYGSLTVAGHGHTASYSGAFTYAIVNPSTTDSAAVGIHVASSICGEMYAGSLSASETLRCVRLGISATKSDTGNFDDDVLTGDYAFTLAPSDNIVVGGNMSGTSTI